MPYDLRERLHGWWHSAESAAAPLLLVFSFVFGSVALAWTTINYYSYEAETFALAEVEGVWAELEGDTPPLTKTEILAHGYDYRAFDRYCATVNVSTHAYAIEADAFLALEPGQNVLVVYNRSHEIIAFLLDDTRVAVTELS